MKYQSEYNNKTIAVQLQMSKNTHKQISQAIQSIITKGGEQLYESYLNQKLPADCNQNIVTNIQMKFNSMTRQQPIQSYINGQIMPQAAAIDRITPHKMPIRSKSSFAICKKQSTFLLINSQTANSFDSKFVPQPIHSNKPKFSFKYACHKGNPQHNDDIIMRKQKMQRDRKQIMEQKLAKDKIDKNAGKRRILQAKIKEFMVEGIPCNYDDQGCLITIDPKIYKKELQASSKRKKVFQSGPLTIGYKTIDYQSEPSLFNQSSTITGRKRGFSIVKADRKSKINDQQFNNKHQRQSSAIPFMTVADGIKITQKQRNIMAQKQHRSFTSRLQFKQQSQKSLFKSYLPLQSNSRPATNCHSRERNSRQSIGLASVISMSSRPKTSKDTHRVHVANKELAVDMVRENALMARKLFI